MMRAERKAPGLIARIMILLDMIQFQHTVFALPFALLSAFVAAGGLPPVRKVLWIVVAMAGARSAAMAFNRVVDLPFDRLNPRTKDRALPAGRLSIRFARIFTALSSCVFLLAAWRLNRLTFRLSPVALVIILSYSYMKRFSALCHLWLGLSLALAPLGAWIAVKGDVAPAPFLLAGLVLLWVAGFDILYSCQDIAFDRKQGLHSIPVCLGLRNSLALSTFLHMGMIAGLVWFWHVAGMGCCFLAGVMLVGLFLAWEHRMIRADDMRSVNAAFFAMNGLVSVVLMTFGVLDILIR